MALTVVIKQGPPNTGHDEPDGDLTLRFESPRIVIGRSKSCDVLIPDSSVSARHTSIRRQGSDTVVVDEGSSNGTVVGNVKLPPHSPRLVRDGELLRVGRQWLVLHLSHHHSGTDGAGSNEALRIARMLFEQKLRSDGDPVDPQIDVLEGEDRGASLPLANDGRTHTIGRSKGCDLTLSDVEASRRHLAVEWGDGGWSVYDLGSKRGATLDGQELSNEPRPWPIGAQLTVGSTVLTLSDPVPEALKEVLEAPDEKMSPKEIAAPAPAWLRPADDDEEDDSDDDAIVEAPEDPGEMDLRDSAPPEPQATQRAAPMPSRTVDGIVLLVAISLLTLSIAGLLWVLR